MTWDDKPFYQKYAAVKTTEPTNVTFIEKYRPKQNMAKPSQIHLWYAEELRKKENGLENEIDLNEIRAAKKGARNRWFYVVKKYPEVFMEDKTSKINWHEVIKLI